jgi:nitrogen fixation/metabolism regulation signal transduction histidine kinase
VINKIEIKIVLRIVFLLLLLIGITLLIDKGLWIYTILLIPFILYQVRGLYNFHRRTILELSNFIDALHYKDFSRRYDEKYAPAELKFLRLGFNAINNSFRAISKEKEAQYQYLQKTLELVNTGILNYEIETGDVIWVNESLKQMLQIPYLKTIQSLEKRDIELYDDITNLKPGDGKITALSPEKGSYKILLSATAFETEGKVFKLVAFQNISEAIDVTEAKAWKKLLSVMTHEIMNSVAPISSLADTMQHTLHKSHPDFKLKSGIYEDLDLGISTIKNRSESLLKFAQTYRNLNKINQPKMTDILARNLFENIYNLMQPTLEQKGVELDIVLKHTDLRIYADESLIEQVLINLVTNAIDAVKDSEEKQITLTGGKNEQKQVFIKVTDTGHGMEKDVLENIFIPFFTTKKTGSGIGLSLCKEILLLHRGNIHVQSKIMQGTAFTLLFASDNHK